MKPQPKGNTKCELTKKGGSRNPRNRMTGPPKSISHHKDTVYFEHTKKEVQETPATERQNRQTAFALQTTMYFALQQSI